MGNTAIKKKKQKQKTGKLSYKMGAQPKVIVNIFKMNERLDWSVLLLFHEHDLVLG